MSKPETPRFNLIFNAQTADGRKSVEYGFYQILWGQDGKIEIPQIPVPTKPVPETRVLLHIDDHLLSKVIDIGYTVGISNTLGLYLHEEDNVGHFYLRATPIDNIVDDAEAPAAIKLYTDWTLEYCSTDPLNMRIMFPGKRMTIGYRKPGQRVTDDKPVHFRSIQGPYIDKAYFGQPKRKFEYAFVH